MVDVVSEVFKLPDHADFRAAVEPRLADTCVHERGLDTWIGADQEYDVGVLDFGDRRVEQVGLARTRPEGGARRAAVDVRYAESGGEILRGLHGLGVLQVASNDAYAGCVAFQSFRDGFQRRVPVGGLQFAADAHVGAVEALAGEAVPHEAGLVADPLLVDRVVHDGKNAHHAARTGVDPYVGADRVHNVDGRHLVELPRPRVECVGLGRERAHGTEVDDIAGKLGRQGLLQICRDFSIFAA